MSNRGASKSFTRASRLKAYFSDGAANRAVPINQRRRIRDTGLESLLSSALLADDGELRQIIEEVDEISRMLQSTEARDPQSLPIASHPAVWSAFKYALLDRELRYLALTDDLTCLYNRRGFFAAAAQQLKLARRNSQDMLLLFCDVDNLKQINDTYGHQEGDLALIRTADALSEAFRDSDVMARLGGDEFAVLALKASADSQELMFRRLEKQLRKSSADETRYTLSLSVGLSRFDPHHPASLGELMAQADKAMYKQKPSRAQGAIAPQFNDVSTK